MNIEIIVPLVIGLVEVAKRSGLVKNEYLPLAGVVLGVALSVLSGGANAESLIVGITAGLVSSGLWDFGKSGYVAGKEIFIK